MNRIYFDSFPRSGNHYFMINFYKNFGSSKIIWGMHNINFLDKKNMITIVRDPISSIASYCIMEKNKNPKIIIKENYLWLEKTFLNKNDIHIIDFYSLVTNTNNEMKRIQKKYFLQNEENNISFPYKEDYESIRHGFLPNNKRNKIKNDFVKILTKKYEKMLNENLMIFDSIILKQNDII